MSGGVNDPGKLLSCHISYNYDGDGYENIVATMKFERWISSTCLSSKEDAIALLNNWRTPNCRPYCSAPVGTQAT